MQGPLRKDLTRISTQDLLTIYLSKIMQGPLRGSHQGLHKIFSQGPVQDHARTSVQDHARTSDKISSGSSQHLLTRTSTRSCLKLLQDRHSRTFQKTHKKYFYQDLTESTKISIGPQRGRSDTHKVPRGLRERHPHSNRPTTRAIRQPQSSERVARSHVRFSQNLARTTKHEHLKKSKTTFYLGLIHFCVEVYEVLPLPRKMSPRHPKCCTCRTESSSCQQK